jgi:hypothetical protein
MVPGTRGDMVYHYYLVPYGALFTVNCELGTIAAGLFDTDFGLAQKFGVKGLVTQQIVTTQWLSKSDSFISQYFVFYSFILLRSSREGLVIGTSGLMSHDFQPVDSRAGNSQSLLCIVIWIIHLLYCTDCERSAVLLRRFYFSFTSPSPSSRISFHFMVDHGFSSACSRQWCPR